MKEEKISHRTLKELFTEKREIEREITRRLTRFQDDYNISKIQIEIIELDSASGLNVVADVKIMADI